MLPQVNAKVTLQVPVDGAGATTSILCAIHCAVMPFAVGVLPLLELQFLASETAEWSLLCASLTLAIVSLSTGFRYHRSKVVALLVAIGIVLLVCGRWVESHALGRLGLPCVVCGGFTIAVAHITNHRLCRKCRKETHHVLHSHKQQG